MLLKYMQWIPFIVKSKGAKILIESGITFPVQSNETETEPEKLTVLSLFLAHAPTSARAPLL